MSAVHGDSGHRRSMEADDFPAVGRRRGRVRRTSAAYGWSYHQGVAAAVTATGGRWPGQPVRGLETGAQGAISTDTPRENSGARNLSVFGPGARCISGTWKAPQITESQFWPDILSPSETPIYFLF